MIKKIVVCSLVPIILLLSFGCSQKQDEKIYTTLTPEQQSKVDYPKFYENEVYWVPKGYSYHATDECYTLSRSKTVLSGTLDEALAEGKSDPCSKCVGH